MMSPGGERLRAARAEKGFSIDDIAQRLKVPARYVTAMEEGDIAALPEQTFVRGYVRAYARLVGLDAEPLLAALDPVELKAPKPLVGIEGAAMPKAPRRSGRGGKAFRLQHRHWLAAAVLGLAVFGISTWVGRESEVSVPAAPTAAIEAVAELAESSPSTSLTQDVALPGVPAPAVVPTAGTAAAAPAASAPAAAASSPAVGAPAIAANALQPAAAAPRAIPGKGLFLHFGKPSWVEVRDAGNLVIHSSFAAADSDLALEGTPPLTLTLGDASSAEIWWNGESVATDRYSRTGVTRIVVGKASAR